MRELRSWQNLAEKFSQYFHIVPTFFIGSFSNLQIMKNLNEVEG